LEDAEKSVDHPKEDLAKSGYKLEIKYKILIILLYIWLHNENPLLITSRMPSSLCITKAWAEISRGHVISRLCPSVKGSALKRKKKKKKCPLKWLF
jgi:hypothetical protein